MNNNTIIKPNLNPNSDPEQSIKAYNPVLDDTNYDNSEFIFSWTTDSPMIRPDLFKFEQNQDPDSESNSDNNRSQDDEQSPDEQSPDEQSLDNEQYLEYSDTDERPYELNNMEKEPCNKKVHFADSVSEETTDKKKEVIEGMSSVPPINSEELKLPENSGSIGISSISSCILSVLCWFCFLLFIAHMRGELSYKNGSLNMSLILCILLFPHLYLGFVLVDWLTKPQHYNC
jgi:hypothetical protein